MPLARAELDYSSSGGYNYVDAVVLASAGQERSHSLPDGGDVTAMAQPEARTIRAACPSRIGGGHATQLKHDNLLTAYDSSYSTYLSY